MTIRVGNGDRINVLVYGTLKAGYGLHYLLHSKRCTLIGRARLEGYAMHDLGAFPCIVHDVLHGGSIVGEVYAVDHDTLDRLDVVESNGRLYDRVPEIARMLDGDLEGDDVVVEVYVWHGGPNRLPAYARPMETGCW
jgi:gamma-glutamylcyclotransferase (GGCT)/AIG2-like uncharacterized protein YtfP